MDYSLLAWKDIGYSVVNIMVVFVEKFFTYVI